MLFNNGDHLDCDGRVNAGGDSSARYCVPSRNNGQLIMENTARGILGTATIVSGPLKQDSANTDGGAGSLNKCDADGNNKSLDSPPSQNLNITHHQKGVKRPRNEQSSNDCPARPALVLSSVSNNIANNNQHDQQHQSSDQAQQQQQQQQQQIACNRSAMARKLPEQACSTGNYIEARPFDMDQHQQQRPNCCSETSSKLPSDNNDDQAKDNNRHLAMEDEEQYEYETILAKILNEKKLSLANSPEVISFLCNVKPSNRNYLAVPTV